MNFNNANWSVVAGDNSPEVRSPGPVANVGEDPNLVVGVPEIPAQDAPVPEKIEVFIQSTEAISDLNDEIAVFELKFCLSNSTGARMITKRISVNKQVLFDEAAEIPVIAVEEKASSPVEKTNALLEQFKRLAGLR